jgi:hypothetical protein
MDKRTVKRGPYQKPTLEQHKGWAVTTGLSTGSHPGEPDIADN